MSQAPIVFLDTETDGLHPGRRVWEVAMIRRDDSGVRERHFFVGLDLRNSDPFGLRVGGYWDRHPAGRKVSGKPGVPGPPPLCKHDAAREVMEWTFDAHLVGVNPAFDADTLAGLLRAEGYLASWHYHLIDVAAMAYGWLHSQPVRFVTGVPATTDPMDLGPGKLMAIPHQEVTIERQPIGLPWRSDDLSRACGVEPPTDEDRHTAIGNARWAMRWFDTITTGAAA